MSRKVLFTLDWEPWFALYAYSSRWEKMNDLVEEPTHYLLDLLRRHQIKAIWYLLGWLQDKLPSLVKDIQSEGHTIGYHSYYHKVNDSPRWEGVPYRAPRFKGQRRLYSGGFWLRSMPYWWLKREVMKEGQFFIHPHDVMLEHPKLSNPWQNWYRHVGLKTSRDKLERLTREIEWAEASQLVKS